MNKNVSFIHDLLGKDFGGSRTKTNKKDIHQRIREGAIIKKQCSDLVELNTVKGIN